MFKCVRITAGDVFPRFRCFESHFRGPAVQSTEDDPDHHDRCANNIYTRPYVPLANKLGEVLWSAKTDSCDSVYEAHDAQSDRHQTRCFHQNDDGGGEKIEIVQIFEEVVDQEQHPGHPKGNEKLNPTISSTSAHLEDLDITNQHLNPTTHRILVAQKAAWLRGMHR